MERPRATTTLHELLLEAVERAAYAQRESASLIEQQRDVLAELHETLAQMGRRGRAYGNGQRDAGRHSELG
jgi:hypothetical protein